MTTAERVTFADWQLSKRIVPWTIVHDWSEFAYWWRLLVARMTRAAKVIVAAFAMFVDAMRPTIDAITRLAAAWNEAIS